MTAAERFAAIEAEIRKDERERCIRACLYLAAEWRDFSMGPGREMDQTAKDLRERSAEACEFCASRLGWDRPTHAKENEK